MRPSRAIASGFSGLAGAKLLIAGGLTRGRRPVVCSAPATPVVSASAAQRQAHARKSRSNRSVMGCVEAQAGGNFKTNSSAAAAPCVARARITHQEPAFAHDVADHRIHAVPRSAPIQELTLPGPSDQEIDTLIRIASRVPDHGRLEPWRFILYRGAARDEVGDALAALAERREGPLPENAVEQELTRFSRAPLVIGVVSSPKAHPKIPQWEMFLSAGAAAMNLVIAANALGYGANWITNWYSDHGGGAPHPRACTA